ncbi:MAG: hypothetical protein NWF05_02390 [Candidatus Bathyarchaeota archaeon]|nr:hypothetical protein [Candidatus Bathyarchaeota archaeon]
MSGKNADSTELIRRLTPIKRQSRKEAEEQVDEKTKRCSSCGAITVYVYSENLRVGGTSGGWKLLFGEWAEIGEQTMPVEVYICQRCGKIEFFATEELKQRLLRQAYKTNQ